MKLTTLLAAALLPVGLMAAPVDDLIPVLTPHENSPSEIFGRSYAYCDIVGGASQVNCRTGAGTGYSIKYKLPKGSNYAFSCVQSGECITINGFTNCGWHKIGVASCYVNGHYTSSGCTLKALGRC